MIKRGTSEKGVKVTYSENYVLNRKVYVKTDIKIGKRSYLDEIYTVNVAFKALLYANNLFNATNLLDQ